MIDILTASIGVGLAISLMFSEVFGLAAGGMVVPGYIALYLNRPIDIILTIAASLITYFVVTALSTFIIVYGKRRTVLITYPTDDELAKHLPAELVRQKIYSPPPHRR